MRVIVKVGLLMFLVEVKLRIKGRWSVTYVSITQQIASWVVLSKSVV